MSRWICTAHEIRLSLWSRLRSFVLLVKLNVIAIPTPSYRANTVKREGQREKERERGLASAELTGRAASRMLPT